MKRLVTVATLGLALLAPAKPALATANEHASCAGIALSEHGSAHEMKSVIHDEVKPLAAALGVPMGGLVSAFAKVHAGTHAACEGAVPEP